MIEHALKLRDVDRGRRGGEDFHGIKAVFFGPSTSVFKTIVKNEGAELCFGNKTDRNGRFHAAINAQRNSDASLLPIRGGPLRCSLHALATRRAKRRQSVPSEGQALSGSSRSRAARK